MAKALQKYESNSPVKECQLAKLYSFKDKKAHYRKSYIAWDNIERTNQTKSPVYEKAKYLSEAAGKIIAPVIQKLAKNEKVFFNHIYISKITKRERRQNQRIIKQLSNIFDITYHNSVTYNGKKYRYSYEFSHKQQMQENISIAEISVESKMTRQNTDVYIDNKNKNIEDIDLQRSNFKKNVLKEEKKFLTLKDFPIGQEEFNILRQKSERGFNLNFMNQLSFKLSKSKKPPIFYSKNGFYSYFSDCLKNEERKEEIANRDNFYIKDNLTPEEKEDRTINKYLGEIEYSLQVSPEWHFRKKIAGGTLRPKKAFYFLNAFSSIEIQESVAKIYLTKEVELFESDLKILLNQVKASHEIIGNPLITEIQLITPNSTKQVKEMSDINQQILNSFGNIRGQEILNICSIVQHSDKIMLVEVKANESIPENDKHLLRKCIKNTYGEDIEIRTIPKIETNVMHWEFGAQKDNNFNGWETRISLWRRFKQEMLRYQEDALFKSWFEKMQRTENRAENKLILSGTGFITSWCVSNFSWPLEQVAKKTKINIELVYPDNRERPVLFRADGQDTFVKASLKDKADYFVEEETKPLKQIGDK